MSVNVVKIFAISALYIAITHAALADEFCDGFERGYISGYKQNTGSPIDPILPICPIEPIKQMSDPESDFEFGYTIGYQKGLRTK